MFAASVKRSLSAKSVGAQVSRTTKMGVNKTSSLNANLHALRAANFSKISLPQADLGLKERDPEMANLIKEEQERQRKGIYDVLT